MAGPLQRDGLSQPLCEIPSELYAPIADFMRS